MARPRFSIACLLAVVFFVAIGVAGLRAASDSWDSALLGLTVLILLTSVLLAVHRAGDRRAYWLGFALFGWLYLGASLVPSIEDRLPTAKALAFVGARLPRPPDEGWVDDLNAISDDVMKSYIRTGRRDLVNPNISNQSAAPRRWDVTVFRYPTSSPGPNYIKRLVAPAIGPTASFVRIGHSLFALLLAYLGGHVSRHLDAAGRRSGNMTAEPRDDEQGHAGGAAPG